MSGAREDEPKGKAKTGRVLVVEDDEILRGFLVEAVTGMGHEVRAVATTAEAAEEIARQRFDAVVTDLRLPDGEGLEVLRFAKEHDAGTEVLVVTAYGTIEKAVEAMKAGAREFLLKPFPVEVVERLLSAALEARFLRREVEVLRREVGARGAFDEVWGTSEAVRKVVERAAKVAPSDVTVLFIGPTGSGKEVVARALHRASRRADGPFVPVHASAVPETLLEAELFGHARGAFTGAVRDRKGLVEEAEGGTLFLDEVGEVPPEVQVKLLRFLQDRTFRRVGENRERTADCRVLAATNRNLAEAVRAGRFREDLYYRLNIVPIEVPPLAARREDIPILAQRFLDRFAGPGRTLRFAPHVLEAFARYDWPGNVRELENVCRRAAALAEGPVVSETYLDVERPTGEEARPENLPLPEALADLERRMIRRALETAGGVRAKAAEILGIKRTTLVEKLKRMGMEYEESKK